MSYKGREIEVKLHVPDSTLTPVARILRDAFQISRSVYNTSTDTYWHLPEGVRGDFIRMRELENCIQVTVKGKDKGSNLDRIEVELETLSSRTAVKNLLTAAHGRPAGTVTKSYHVFWLEGESEHTNVSCYSIQDHADGVYIEIESTSVDKVLELETKVLEVLGRANLHVRRARGSLYELYISKTEGVL